MTEYALLIDGQRVQADKQFAVLNPATEKVIAKVPDASQAQVNEAVMAAHNAFSTWRKDESFRRQCLIKIAKCISEQKEAFARLLSQEQGKPLKNAVDEVAMTARRFQAMAEMPIPVDVLQDDDDTRVETHMRPVGVVAIITPWNFPLAIASKIAVPMLLGNTVVIKPSPYTPLTTLKLGKVLHDVLPAGVVNVLSGSDEVGKWLTQHELVQKISFTGSVPTGKKIADVAANDLKRVILELGGNDPAIVLPDANVKAIAEKVFWGAFANCGQICTATKRLYVHEKLFQPMVDELIKLANAVKVGEGLDPNTQLGPLNNAAQLDIVSHLVEDARHHGAEIVTGGFRLDREGYFYHPTLVTNIKEGIDLVDKEQFGPALPIMSFSNDEEVIERANKTKMGLAASVWAGDWQRAQQVADQIEAGTVWVNRIHQSNPNSPFGGFKHSGIGREGGIFGLQAYSELQTINIAK